MDKIKILCVDDNSEILNLCRDFLLSEGYAVRCALDGPTAIEAFRIERADIVVTDIRMPGMDGLEVLRAIKKIDELTEVIILTGHATIDTAVSAFKNGGAFDFLTKPLDDLENLLLAIEKAMAHRSLRVENAILVEELSRNQIHLTNRNKQLHQAQNALKLSRQRYLDLYNRAPVGYIAIDAKGTIIEANRTSATLFNISLKAMRHKPFADFVPPDQAVEYETFLTDMKRTATCICELPLSRADGSTFFAHIEGMAIFNDNNQISQFRMTVSDTTSEIETKLALQESEERYRTLVETIPHGIQEIDTNGIITFANTSHAALHGYTINELIGMSVTELSNSKTEGRLLQRYLNNLVKAQPSPQTWIGRDRTKDGRTKDIQVDWDYKRNVHGEVVGFVSVLSDFTERKKAETRLKESEMRYRSFVENFTGIAFRLNPTGIPVFYHGAVKTITGYNEDELVACNPGWEELIDPKELSLVRMRRKQICLPGEHSITQEYRIRHRDGQWRWVREHAQNTCSSDGRLTAIQGVVFDITDYKRLQNKYFETRKLEAIGTLAGGIAHKFNNALAGLLGNVELLEMERHKQKTQTLDYTGSMMVIIKKMSQLTNQLLAYARGGKYLPTEIALNDLIKQSVNLIGHRIGPDLNIELELTPQNDWISGDTAQLQMVILAILDNAMEATSQKGRILIQTQPLNRQTDFIKNNPQQTSGKHICISIQDDGCGMDTKTQKQIFEPFFTTKFVGRGLGLSAAYGIVSNHDGWMEVTSTPGEGTAIKICLPTVTRCKPQLIIEEANQLVGSDTTVLVVEDDDAVMKTTCQLLKTLNYNTLEASTGNKALDVLNACYHQIDAVLLDIQLPDMEAGDLYTRMLEIEPDIRVVACSGYDQKGPAEALLDAGALGFLQKPFSRKELAAKLHKVINAEALSQKAIDVNGSNPDTPANRSHLKLV